jgi:hypothetical protein
VQSPLLGYKNATSSRRKLFGDIALKKTAVPFSGGGEKGLGELVCKISNPFRKKV